MATTEWTTTNSKKLKHKHKDNIISNDNAEYTEKFKNQVKAQMHHIPSLCKYSAQNDCLAHLTLRSSALIISKWTSVWLFDMSQNDSFTECKSGVHFLLKIIIIPFI